MGQNVTLEPRPIRPIRPDINAALSLVEWPRKKKKKKEWQT